MERLEGRIEEEKAKERRIYAERISAIENEIGETRDVIADYTSVEGKKIVIACGSSPRVSYHNSYLRVYARGKLVRDFISGENFDLEDMPLIRDFIKGLEEARVTSEDMILELENYMIHLDEQKEYAIDKGFDGDA
jgi:hypothetical protein